VWALDTPDRVGRTFAAMAGTARRRHEDTHDEDTHHEDTHRDDLHDEQITSTH